MSTLGNAQPERLKLRLAEPYCVLRSHVSPGLGKRVCAASAPSAALGSRFTVLVLPRDG